MNNAVSRRGFTIVELLIVIVVIGILATVVIVAFRGVQQSARDNSVLSDVDALDGIQTSYALRNSGLGGKAWYSGSGSDADINFTPSAGNVIDIVVNNTTKDYCIRVYNPNATKYKYLSTAAQKESNTGVCAANPASAAAIAAAPAAPPAPGETLVWAPQTGSGSRDWRALDVSSDGSKIVATTTATDYIYRSLDSGATWAPITAAGSRIWLKATISDDGTKLAADTTAGLYNSTDSGATWTLRPITLSPGDHPSGTYGALNASADGMKLLIFITNDDLCGGYFYVSSNAGTTWTSTGIYECGAVALVSADGTKMLAISRYGYINRSSNGGTSWTQNAPAIGGNNWAIAFTTTISSTNLSFLTLSVSSSGIWRSTDNGLTWTVIPSLPTTYYATASSANGRIQYAAPSGVSGLVYASTDYGVTWSARTGTGSRTWRSIVTSDNGEFVVAAFGSGNIYTGTFQ